jgi:purine-nucleoside phosphorylase
MSYEYKDYLGSAGVIKDRIKNFKPEVLMVLGSGLGFMADYVENPKYVGYKSIPNFKVSTAPGHRGRLVFGELFGKKVMLMQGRFHTYEGYSIVDVAYPVRVAKLLGVKTMIVTNAAGAVNTNFNAGDIMLITDHIKLFMSSPLTGPNIEQFGERFPDMSRVYDRDLQEIARQAAIDLGIELREGVYMFFPGPQFETPAEVMAARILGADAVGMSTVPEAIAANQCGIKTLGLTLCSNMAAGVLGKPLSGEEVNEAAEASAPKFSSLVAEILKRI